MINLPTMNFSPKVKYTLQPLQKDPRIICKQQRLITTWEILEILENQLDKNSSRLTLTSFKRPTPPTALSLKRFLAWRCLQSGQVALAQSLKQGIARAPHALNNQIRILDQTQYFKSIRFLWWASLTTKILARSSTCWASSKISSSSDQHKLLHFKRNT